MSLRLNVYMDFLSIHFVLRPFHYVRVWRLSRNPADPRAMEPWHGGRRSQSSAGGLPPSTFLQVRYKTCIRTYSNILHIFTYKKKLTYMHKYFYIHSIKHPSGVVICVPIFYCVCRDCRASSRIQIAKATSEGTLVSEPYELTTDWETANYDVRHPTASALDGSSW